MKSFVNQYKILGLTPHASIDEIKKAFYKLAKKYHPDLNQNTPEGTSNKFQAIQEAYKALTNDREAYDTQYNYQNLKGHQKEYRNQNFENLNFSFWKGKQHNTHQRGYSSPWSFSSVWSDMGLNEQPKNSYNRAFIDSDEEVEDFYGYRYVFKPRKTQTRKPKKRTQTEKFHTPKTKIKNDNINSEHPKWRNAEKSQSIKVDPYDTKITSTEANQNSNPRKNSINEDHDGNHDDYYYTNTNNTQQSTYETETRFTEGEENKKKHTSSTHNNKGEKNAIFSSIFNLASRVYHPKRVTSLPIMNPNNRAYGNRIENVFFLTEDAIFKWLKERGDRHRLYGVYRNGKFKYNFFWNKRDKWRRQF